MKSIWSVCLYRKRVYQSKVTILWTPGVVCCVQTSIHNQVLGGPLLCGYRRLFPTRRTPHGVAALLFLKREGLSLHLAGGVPDKRVICFVLCCFIVCFGRRFRKTKIPISSLQKFEKRGIALMFCRHTQKAIL